MSVKKNTRSEDMHAWWAEQKQRTLEDYYRVARGCPSALRAWIGYPEVSAEEMGISVMKKTHSFFDGLEGSMLSNALKDGNNIEQYLEFIEGVPFITLRAQSLGSREDLGLVAVVCADDSSWIESENLKFLRENVELHLPKDIEEALIGRLYDARYSEIMDNLEKKLDSEINKVYMTRGVERSFDLVNLVTGSLILDNGPITPRQAYESTLFMSPKEIADAKTEALKSVSDFYFSLVYGGKMSEDQMERNLSFDTQEIDRVFSHENRLLGRLSFMLDNIGTLKGEIAPSDIARVAVRAEKDSRFAPVVGKQLDKWVKDSAKEYIVNLDKVNSKRLEFGGTVHSKALEKVPLTPVQKKGAKKFFQHH